MGQNLAVRLRSVEVDLIILRELRQTHKKGCAGKGCQRCATFRKQLDSLAKERAVIVDKMRAD